MSEPKSAKNISGFTVIEMLVVVSMIGILASIAIPSYCKYNSRAKQAQAKVILATLYSAEQAFRMDTLSFTACLGAIGAGTSSMQNMVGVGTQYYAYGFNAGFVPNNKCGPNGAQPCLQEGWIAPIFACPSASDPIWVAATAPNQSPTLNPTPPGNGNLVPIPTSSGPANFVTSSTFYAMAVGNVSGCNSAYDRWSIDQNKNIYNMNTAL